MTKLLKNRLIIVIICSVLALVALMAYTNSVRSQAVPIKVIRLTADISKGDMISKDSVELVTVGGYNMTGSFVTDINQVVGKYAAMDLAKDSILLKAHVSDNIITPSDRLKALDGSQVAYSVSIKDFSNGLSDKLMAGDIVSIYIYKDGKAIRPSELTYVQVLTTTTADGVDREDRDSESGMLSTVTLLVTNSQAIKLTEFEDSAEIHFALVYRGDEEVALQFLKKQGELLPDNPYAEVGG